MKRKTNLFYTSGTDSNFITFSNYTEAMTGNFLATNVKLFPSKFLCLNIPRLTNDNRQDFIKQLAAYYENKVAFLRDKCREHQYNIETRLKLLGYLLDFIYNYDDTFKINYVGQVTEQDYNGIYADTICVIDSSECTYGELARSSQQDITLYEDYSNESRDYLYGWNYKEISTGSIKYSGPTEYENVKPVVDSNMKYFYNPRAQKINIVHPSLQRDIAFNCLIPLFDIINVDKNENTDIIQNFDEIDCMADASAVINVPYGIWFSKETITLTRDNTEYSPAWSLVIGSQFKPFPYSSTPISEVDQSDRTAAFMTFSQILIRQNQLLNKMMNMTTQISALNKRVADVESNLKSTGTSYNIDGLHKEIIDVRKDCSYMLTQMQQEIDEMKL